MNNELFNEKEIDLKDMLFYICKRWRSILVGMLAFMLAVVIFKLSSVMNLNGAGAVFKQIIKYAVIGLIVGFVVMAVFYAAMYAFTGRIKSESEFKTCCKLCVLGVLPKIDEKKLNGIDRFVRHVFGVDRKAEDFDGLSDRLSEEIKALLSVRSNGNCRNEGNDKNAEKCTPHVSVISSEGETVSVKMAGFFEKKLNSSANVTSAGDILTSAKGVQDVVNAASVIVVERIGTSKYVKVEEELTKLLQWEKDILGVVLLDGDMI